ncbi:hypothetical protein FQZ97_1105330 [compost metagenome]
MQVITTFDQQRLNALVRQQRCHQHANRASTYDQYRNFQLAHRASNVARRLTAALGREFI